MTSNLKAPFPWYGGKSRAAALVWSRLGRPANYVEPFAGGLGILLGRPHPGQLEIVNDLDGHIVNFWRAVQADPAAVCRYLDWPITELDLNSRHQYLVMQREVLESCLRADARFYDAEMAAWWVWGLCLWIGAGWCSSTVLSRSRKRPMVCRSDGRGAFSAGRGIMNAKPRTSAVHGPGNGVHSSEFIGGQRPHVSSPDGINGHTFRADGFAVLAALQDRLRDVRVLCGDWKRVLTPAMTTYVGVTGVVLDPPYHAATGRKGKLYAKDSADVSDDVRAWALENGDNPKLRIALCGYEGEHDMPVSWTVEEWASPDGFNGNRSRERIWFSPNCLQPTRSLFT